MSAPVAKPRRVTVFVDEDTYRAIQGAAIKRQQERGGGHASMAAWIGEVIESALKAKRGKAA